MLFTKNLHPLSDAVNKLDTTLKVKKTKRMSDKSIMWNFILHSLLT